MKKIGTLLLVAIFIAAIVALGVFSAGFKNWDVNTWFKAQNGDSAVVYARQSVQSDNDNLYNDVSVMTDYGSYISSNLSGVYVNYTKTPIPSTSTYTFIFTPQIVEGYTFIGILQFSGAGDYVLPIVPNADGVYSVVLNSLGGNMAEAIYERNKAPLPLPPDPVREGYTFTGWYLDEACTVRYNGEAVVADTQLYAGWTQNNYTVTFNVDGGNAVSSRSIPYGTSISDLPTATRVGHNFVCWLIGDVEYTNQPITADTVLTAKYIKIKYTVNFIVNGEIYKTMEIEFGTSFEIALEKANLKNYTVLVATFENGENADNITSNGIIEIREKTFTENFQSNWLNIAVYGGIGIVVFVILIALFKKRA